MKAQRKTDQFRQSFNTVQAGTLVIRQSKATNPKGKRQKGSGQKIRQWSKHTRKLKI